MFGFDVQMRQSSLKVGILIFKARYASLFVLLHPNPDKPESTQKLCHFAPEFVIKCLTWINQNQHQNFATLQFRQQQESFWELFILCTLAGLSRLLFTGCPIAAGFVIFTAGGAIPMPGTFCPFAWTVRHRSHLKVQTASDRRIRSDLAVRHSHMLRMNRVALQRRLVHKA